MSLVEKTNEGTAYFCISDLVGTQTPPLPSRSGSLKLGILWDCSKSRAKSNWESKDIPFITHLITHLRNCVIDVYLFRDKVEPPNSFTLSNGDSSSVVSFLKQSIFDGATCLGELNLSRFQKKQINKY